MGGRLKGLALALSQSVATFHKVLFSALSRELDREKPTHSLPFTTANSEKKIQGSFTF